MFAHSIATLMQAAEFFRLNPTGRLVVNPRDGFPLPLSAAEFRRWFRDCLNRKINVRGGLVVPADNRDLEHFHRTYTGTRVYLRRRELVRVAMTIDDLPTRHQFILAFADRAHGPNDE